MAALSQRVLVRLRSCRRRDCGADVVGRAARVCDEQARARGAIGERVRRAHAHATAPSIPASCSAALNKCARSRRRRRATDARPGRCHAASATRQRARRRRCQVRCAAPPTSAVRRDAPRRSMLARRTIAAANAAQSAVLSSPSSSPPPPPSTTVVVDLLHVRRTPLSRCVRLLAHIASRDRRQRWRSSPLCVSPST